MKYYKEDGALNLSFGKYNLYLNHPILFFSTKNNEFEEREKRFKLSFGIGLNFTSNKDLDYFYLGFLILGFGLGVSKQNYDELV